MNQNANYFKLGIFVIASILVGALFLIIFGAGDFFKKQELAETYFNESVQGLSIGSEVKYKGIQIGTVHSIQSAARIYQTQSDYVLVIIALEEEISLGQTGKDVRERLQKAIKNGLVIRLSFKGLTGAAYLETDYVPQHPDEVSNFPWTPRHPYIPSQKSNMKQYGDALNQILDNLAAINLKGITLDIEHLLSTLNQKTSEFDSAGLIELTRSLISEFKDTNQKLSSALDSGTIRELVADIGKAAATTRAMATRIDTLTWTNSGKISNILENLEDASDNLKQMSQDLKRYPGRILFEKPPERILPEEKK